MRTLSLILKKVLLGSWLLTGVIFATAAHAGGTDPTTAPMPAPGLGSSERAWVFNFKYDADNPAALVNSILSDVPASQQISAPPQLEVSTYDQYGVLIDAFHIAYPSWVNVFSDTGIESLEIQTGHTGRFNFPFSTDVATVRLRDLADGSYVLTIETRPILLGFCASGKVLEGDYCLNNRTESIFSSGFE